MNAGAGSPTSHLWDPVTLLPTTMTAEEAEMAAEEAQMQVEELMAGGTIVFGTNQEPSQLDAFASTTVNDQALPRNCELPLRRPTRGHHRACPE